ncbi:Flp pilus assembly complex ATPase component TadA [Rhodopirellula sp. JC740]|uniref:Flp pilus assembly complex ATPase component TadA n=1 Tax=Rhodopirellula halodulae TaxID=2894198 RepID=A0ABS8NM22_9BACT|nr:MULTISPECIES: ATPase, T2SS/T4P/T4SS family [unclassified Rhodopirellula]MCC9644424.1 Flp pilus assembly complex ATPase component TadA [Rhodopirellula sp. JC740]MCC9655853.1 Flp pilus assembly complex ATPase component TadA [Rhodopirellula sp. JC737]
MAPRRIGQILVDLGFLTDDQLQIVLDEQEQQPGALFGKVAEDMQLITDEQLIQALAEQMGMQTVSLEDAKLEPEVMEKISETMAQLYRCVPVQFEDNTLTIATCDPQNLNIQDELRTFLGFEIRILVATEADVNKTITKYYDSEAESVEKLVAELAEDEELKAAASLLDNEKFNITDAEALADSAPVRKLLNMVLLLAIKDHASDIHFEPFEDEFRIRIKSEGVLYEMVPPPRHLAFAITTRIKVMANLDIAERRMPQDGRIELMVGGHPVDLRVSVLPTIFGESTVMRVLDRSVVNLSLDNVGMNEETMERFRSAIDRPNGIVLVTGPTGSGKTTTLYSSLSELNDISEKLITTEDPVEYDIDGIIQIPIDSDAGVTFASCLRAILRQDPDTILVGEIRDLETAEIAIQAALTGHLVFSTLHTNDSPSTVTRLTDMGIQPFMICATVEAILAQRLVRRICTSCREKTRVSSDLLMELGMTRDEIESTDYFKGVGCEKCNNTGYKGRIALFELMVLNDTIREMIMRNASTDELRDQAQSDGMIILREFGMNLARDGITTLDEIVRETVVDG